jgi:hypothetical protein
MGLTYHFSFAAPARTKPGDLEAFLKSIEPEAKEMGFNPTLVLNARFDTPERREFARRLVTGFPVEDERLKGVVLPAPDMVWNHDQNSGSARAIPVKAVILVLTDEQQCETIFGFFKYPEEITDIHGKPIAKTGLRNRWISREFVKSPDPRFRKIVRRFADAGFLESEKDEFSPTK